MPSVAAGPRHYCCHPSRPGYPHRPAYVHIVAGATIDDVGTIAAIDKIVARAAVDQIVAVIAIQNVQRARRVVVAGFTHDDVVTVFSMQRIAAEAIRRGEPIAEQDVIAIASEQLVIALAAVYVIDARLPDT